MTSPHTSTSKTHANVHTTRSPDYSAYSETLSLFKNFAAIPIPLKKEDGYQIHPEKIEEEIARGTSVILTSNPRNPTGKMLSCEDLATIQDIARDRAVSMPRMSTARNFVLIRLDPDHG